MKANPIRSPWKKAMVFSIAIVCLAGWLIPAGATEFPYRKDYPGIPTIDTEPLFAGYNAGEIIIVDVRSKIEYDVIHPDGAVHVPIAKKGFINQVKALMSKNPGKKFAFYCNGITCLKSYKAAKKAQEAGLANCFAYDSGIPAWAAFFPEKTQLLGKTLVDPEKQLIPKADFKQKCLPFDAFKSQIAAKGGMAIDVRDHIQRSKKLPGLDKSKAIPMDKFIPHFVAKKAHQNKPLFIYDQVGKQVRWLEYYLVENGYNEYYFLKGGATAVLKAQDYKN